MREFLTTVILAPAREKVGSEPPGATSVWTRNGGAASQFQDRMMRGAVACRILLFFRPQIGLPLGIFLEINVFVSMRHSTYTSWPISLNKIAPTPLGTYRSWLKKFTFCRVGRAVPSKLDQLFSTQPGVGHIFLTMTHCT